MLTLGSAFRSGVVQSFVIIVLILSPLSNKAFDSPSGFTRACWLISWPAYVLLRPRGVRGVSFDINLNR